MERVRVMCGRMRVMCRGGGYVWRGRVMCERMKVMCVPVYMFFCVCGCYESVASI